MVFVRGGQHTGWNLLLCPIVVTWTAIRVYLLPCIFAILLKLAHLGCDCVCKCCRFKDRNFPPDNTSIGKEWLQAHRGTHIKWVRARELGQTIKPTEEQRAVAGKNAHTVLFSGKIEPADIAQGLLGDCWLLAALASMAETPGLIRKVFKTKQTSIRGKYILRLYDAGKKKWHNITVDDYIPVDASTDQPLFSHPHGREMWVLLAEKAVAKFCGGYSNLKGGSEAWAWAALVGARVYGYDLNVRAKTWDRIEYVFKPEDFRSKRAMYTKKAKASENLKTEDLFAVLLLLDLREAIVTCGIQGGGGESKRGDGLVSGHAYTLLSVKEINGYRLLNIRNPWGNWEWKGNWSDHSDMWQKHADIKKALNHTAANDGAFWIQYEDWMGVFNTIAICDRDVGVGDLTMDQFEDHGLCGIIWGCMRGCFKFWCCCRGCRFLYCGHSASVEAPEGTAHTCCCGMCSRHMCLSRPREKLKTWWGGRHTLKHYKGRSTVATA